jgi:hypothetical protein
MRRRAALLLSLLLGGCAASPRLPPFIEKPYEPFSRAEAVAVAWREWRLWGGRIDEGGAASDAGLERQAGLWQRVGEYWWIGLGGRLPEAAWTGKHDAEGRVFAAARDGQFAWSAAFLSYVMRLAGAGTLFPYAADHASYVDAAAAGRAPGLVAEPAERAAPAPGDLVCHGRDWAAGLRFADLPQPSHWPGHCAIVVATAPGSIAVIGGNVDDAVTLTHIPVTDAGRLASPDGAILDRRYPWFVVLRVLYRSDSLPTAARPAG